MATVLQQNLATQIIKNTKRKKPLNKKELLVSAGYSETTAIATPHRELEQAGVKEALIEQGFTVDNAKRVITRILNQGKEENQVRAADMIFKVHGEYAPEKHVNVNIEVEPSDAIKALANGLVEIQRKGNS